MSTDKTNQSWGGRFSEPVDAFVARFTASVTFDQRLYRHDIMGSIAHATMLAKVGVLTDAERDSIIDGLNTIQGEIEAGQFDWRIDLEDVHMNIESRLTSLVGDAGKRLHTGRSRNDQVATDVRLWLRGEIDALAPLLGDMQRALVELAAGHAETVMPGFTHMQVAQPVSFAHHLLAYVEMFARDGERLADVRKRVNRLPLGAAALAGTSYPLDRERVARTLGFDGVEQRLLVLLVVLVVGQRLAFHQGQEAHQVADDPAGLAARQLGHVGVLLLRHDRRARAVPVREVDKAEARAHPQNEFLREPRQVRHDERRRSREFDGEVPIRYRIERVFAQALEAELPRHTRAIDRE